MFGEQRVVHLRKRALNARIAVCIDRDIAFSVEHHRPIVEIRRSDSNRSSSTTISLLCTFTQPVSISGTLGDIRRYRDRRASRASPTRECKCAAVFGSLHVAQEVAERVGVIIVRALAFGREFRAAVDIPAKDEHRALRSRDRLPKDTKIIRAIDQQTKTISMPNAIAIAVRLKKRFGAHAATGFERFFEQIRWTQKPRNVDGSRR
jgi:hypothetical protein